MLIAEGRVQATKSCADSGLWGPQVLTNACWDHVLKISDLAVMSWCDGSLCSRCAALLAPWVRPPHLPSEYFHAQRPRLTPAALC